jgi:hypothetical protein
MSPLDLANGMKRFFDLTERDRENMRENIKEYGMRAYSWSKISKEMQIIYGKCSADGTEESSDIEQIEKQYGS